MIKAIRSSSKKPLGKYFLNPISKFSTLQSQSQDIQTPSPTRFNGFMLPVLYPIWISSNTKIDLSPAISDFIRNNEVSQIAMLAYAPELKYINHDAPLIHQFYRQATLCNISHLKRNEFTLEPIRKIRMEAVTKELEQVVMQEQVFDIPTLKIPDIKLGYQIPSDIETSLDFDAMGNIMPHQELMHIENNNTIYKLEGEIMPTAKFPDGITNDVIFKMFMKFISLSAKKTPEPMQSTIYRNEIVNLSDTAQRVLSLMEPFMFALMIRQKQVFPRLIYQVQEIFETEDIQERMLKNIDLLYRYLAMVSLVQQTGAAVTKDQNKKSMQMQAYQMLQVVRGGLDGNVGKRKFIENIRQEFLKNNPPKEIIKAFEDECNKYMDEDDSFSGNTKDYIETLATIPYNVQSPEKFDVESAKAVLDAKHYGMEQVKKYILEFIAVGQLKKSQKGKVLCLIGPAGVGKTTFAESIAHALDRKFESISLGGVNDSSTLKGHRRTYMHSFAGKIIQALRRCKSSNPVILLDEIDKMGGSAYSGDPRSDLLEILDPNQNFSFVDNYIDHPVDLSNVLFICSANYLHNISRPLIDRLQKIELTSYTDEQKVEIAQRHLLPKTIKESGLAQSDFQLDPKVVKTIIERYTYGESGVRYLDKLLKKIFQKVAVRVVEKEDRPIVINPDNLHVFLDQPDKKKIDYNNLGVGVAVGLGESEDQGGRITIIEVVQRSYRETNKKEGLLKTGNLGDVLKESVDIAYTFTKKFLKEKFNNTYLYEHQLHLHAPEGHSKKNGAGESLTIATALVSIALKKSPKSGIAVAGELSLQGRIMYVSELKEKLLAAKREGIHEVLLPLQNKGQVEKMLPVVTGGLSIHYVQTFQEVQKFLFE